MGDRPVLGSDLSVSLCLCGRNFFRSRLAAPTTHRGRAQIPQQVPSGKTVGTAVRVVRRSPGDRVRGVGRKTTTVLLARPIAIGLPARSLS
jgi:hypothetical protein